MKRGLWIAALSLAWTTGCLVGGSAPEEDPESADPGLSQLEAAAGTDSVALELATACYQYGFASPVLASVRTQVAGKTSAQIHDYVHRTFGTDQTLCRSSSGTETSRALALTKHFVKGYTFSPTLMGGNLLSDNYLLSATGNTNFYQKDDARGPVAVLTRFGMTSSAIEISTNPAWNSIPNAIAESQAKRRAGHRNILLQLMLKDDCCTARTMPAVFRGSGPIVDSDVYARIETYAHDSLAQLLAGLQLPIAYIEFGNELDGGFWTDFDANQSYGGPPARLDRTKLIVQAAKRGIHRAYAERGLGDPFINLHVMPDIYQSESKLVASLQAYLSTSYVGERLFDTVSFSFYPTARNILNPAAYARLLVDIAGQLGVDWAVTEVGLASDLAPGPNPWNNFTDLGLCPGLVGQACSSLPDMQAKLTTLTFGIFNRSPRFFGTLWLAPQDNIGSNTAGVHNPPSDQYRFSPFRFVASIDRDAVNARAEILPAAAAFSDTARTMATPQISSATATCQGNTCSVNLVARHLQPNSIIAISGSSTNSAIVYPDQLTFVTPSVVTFAIPSTLTTQLHTGVSLVVLNQFPYLPGTVSTAYSVRAP